MNHCKEEISIFNVVMDLIVNKFFNVIRDKNSRNPDV